MLLSRRRLRRHFTLLWRLLKQTGNSWLEDRSAHLGAALAFYSVLSLAPLLILVLMIAGMIWGAEIARGQIIDQMAMVVGQKGADAIETMLLKAGYSANAGWIATLAGIGTLFFSASGVFGELQDAMNIIWKAKPRRGRPILRVLRERFTSFTMVAGSGFLLLVSLIISAWLAAASKFISTFMPDIMVLMRIIDFGVSFAIISFLFALTYKVVPDVKISWRAVWPGGLITAALFVIGKTLISLYLENSDIDSTYGAAASFVVLLIWVYYSAQILFFGAEFTYNYSSHYKLHNQLK
jgi:membrane protein